MMVKNGNIALRSDPDKARNFDVAQEGLECGLKAHIIHPTRTATGSTQIAFASRFRVLVATLHDREQAHLTPPEYAVAYATVIAADPEFVTWVIA